MTYNEIGKNWGAIGERIGRIYKNLYNLHRAALQVDEGSDEGSTKDRFYAKVFCSLVYCIQFLNNFCILEGQIFWCWESFARAFLLGRLMLFWRDKRN